MSDFNRLSTEELTRKLQAGKRLLAAKEAQDSLLRFIQFTMPDPDDVEDVDKSQYQVTPQARLLCEVIEKVVAGKLKRVAVAIGPQLGKPVWEEEPIAMADGSLKRLRDIVVGDEVITHRGRGRKVLAVHKQGRLPVLAVTTKKARRIVAAYDHPFLTPEGWKNTSDLESGDILAVPAGWHAGIAGMTLEAARLAGYIVGDGNVTKGQQRVTCFDEEQAADVRACAIACGFGISDAPSLSQPGTISFRGATDWLRALDLAGKNSHTKRVPQQVFMASNEAVAAFVGAYFACDGHVVKKNDRTGKPRKATNVAFYSVNFELLQDVQHLLARLGMMAGIYVKSALKGTNFTNGQPYHSYSLVLCSQNDVNTFAKVVPVVGKKAAVLKDVNARRNTFPTEFLADEVVSVEPAGERPCRCLEVDEDHTFLVRDVVVHNTEVLTRRAPAWIVGRQPKVNIIAGTYNQDFANGLGSDVRAIIESQPYKQVFPHIDLADKAKDFLSTSQRGKLSFVGVGASGTGKAADLFIVDDPFKNDEEAQSEVTREAVWKWFTSVAFTRIHKRAGVIIVHTRWNEDDLIGRLCDPSHPERNKKYAGIADDWTYIDIPAVITDPELGKALGLTLETPREPKVLQQFGNRPMAALWADRKDLSFLAEARRLDPRVFDALYMGKPTPDDGYHFRAENLIEYGPEDLPRDLEIYGASDHAVTEKQINDPNVIGCAGVDRYGHIWVLPDLVWDRMETDRVVEELIAKMKIHKPNLWWMENEVISKSFGPFLRKRMIETNTYTVIDPVTPTKDKISRSRAIQGRMQMNMVHFPRFAAWWPDARSQLLKFPFGANDDFVDWLSWLGLGLLKEYEARPQTANDNRRPRSGSIEWILQQTKRNAVSPATAVQKGWRL